MRTERLKHVADVRVSNVDKKSVEGEVPVKLCNYTDVYYNERITASLDFMAATASPGQRKTFELRRGDVVLTKDSETPEDIGVSTLVVDDIPDLVCGYHLAVVRPRPDVAYGPYIRWVLAGTTARQALATAATGVTRFGLRSEVIADLKVPVPPLEEQRAIVAYLDRETARIDALLAAKHRMITLLDEQWHAALDHLIWSDAPSTIPLMHCVDPVRPVMYGIVLPGPDVGGDGVPIVKGGDVARGRLTWDLLCKTTPEIEAPYARARLRGGDLVYAIRGGIGDVAMVTDELTGANITQDVARVAPRRGVDGRWLMYALQSPTAQSDARMRVTGATITGLNIWELDRVRVPSIGGDMQRFQREELDQHFQRMTQICRTIERQVALFSEHRQALITAAVTGRIDVPVPV